MSASVALPPSMGEGPGSPALSRRLWRIARPIVFVLVGLLALRIVVSLVGSVDWARVASSFGRLSAWMAVPLLADLLLRQWLNAVPLAQYLPGLPLRRSLQNDLTANLMGTVAPPPADMVLRIAMFRSWGLDPVKGMAGVSLNMMTFYSVRFMVPVLGIALLAFQGAERRQWVLAGLSAVIAAVLLSALLLLLRGDVFAAWMGRSAGRLVRRFRSKTDPETWAAAVVDVRSSSADALRRGLGRSITALVGMVLCDALLVFLALRFVGVDGGALSLVDVFAAFLLAYPLTIMPLFGFGVLDAVLLGTWVTIAGVAYEPEIVAGLVVWRTVTILGPLLLGLLSFVVWRRRYGDGVSLRALPPGADGSPAAPAGDDGDASGAGRST